MCSRDRPLAVPRPVRGTVQVPGPQFPAPTAMIWLDMAALVNGGRLAPHILPFCAVAALCAALLPGLAFMLAKPNSGRRPALQALWV